MTNGLGRGLGSLIPSKSAQFSQTPNELPKNDGQAIQIDIDKIIVNSLQPRKQFIDSAMDELTLSVKEYGVIQPLIVCPEKDGKHELIAGERRLRASKAAGLKTVPVIIRKVDDQEKLAVALIENIQREDLNPIDTAQACRKLMDEFNLTQDELAKKIGKPRSSVANTLRMLKLPEDIQLALMDSRITEGHAKYLVGLDSEAKQMALFRKILHNDLSVSDTNKEAKVMGGTKAARIKINYADKDKEFALREFFGAKAEI
ncbi:MAG TPA: ParB/RepB/Spo0J family partition protein, partial [Patescibacteria group bacterium]|nr:ParB/RepB/Spo0J family partition protein [Patescibacteria group bacterium]